MIPSNLSLKPGDLLTYGPLGFFGWIIRIKTWHPVAHVEMYIGDDRSWASRNGIGVGEYPIRTNKLNGVYRPEVTLDWQKGVAYFNSVNGQKYDWKGILGFTTMVEHGEKNKQFCSEFLTNQYRQMGAEPFASQEPADKIAPFELAVSPAFRKIWSSLDFR